MAMYVFDKVRYEVESTVINNHRLKRNRIEINHTNLRMSCNIAAEIQVSSNRRPVQVLRQSSILFNGYICFQTLLTPYNFISSPALSVLRETKQK
jgi:hypothetical protein